MRAEARLATRAMPALWLAVALLSVRLVLLARDAATPQTNGFAGYYTAARLVTRGADVARLYDDAWFGSQMRALGLNVADIYRPNPPTLSILMAPFGLFSYADARILWTIASLLCLVVAIVVLVQTANVTLPLVAALALALHPVGANIEQGQVYLLLLALLALVWRGYHRGHAPLLGVGLAMLLLLKTALPLLGPLVLLQRRWRALAWSLATALVVVLATLPRLGVDAWRAYLPTVLHLGSRPELAVTAYQSQASLTRHLFMYDARWNPAPLVDAPWFAMLLQWSSILIALALTLAVFRTRRNDDLAFAAVVALSLIASPVSAEYHFLLMLVPFVILMDWARAQATLVEWLLLGLSVVLVGVDLPYGSPRFNAGISALLAYPRLYGAWLVWGLSLYGMWRVSPGRGHR